MAVYAAGAAPNTAAWEALQQKQAEGLETVRKQKEVTQGAVGAQQAAQQGAIGEYQMNTGRGLAGSKGLLGGGGGLAMLRSAARERAVGEGQIQGDFAGKIQSAKETAAKAETEFNTEEQKMLQAGAVRQQKKQAALASAQNIYDTIKKDSWWFNDEERYEIERRIRSELQANEIDPEVYTALEQYIKNYVING